MKKFIVNTFIYHVITELQHIYPQIQSASFLTSEWIFEKTLQEVRYSDDQTILTDESIHEGNCSQLSQICSILEKVLEQSKTVFLS